MYVDGGSSILNCCNPPGFSAVCLCFCFPLRFHSMCTLSSYQRLPADSSDLVRIAFAESLASLAETSRRFLETAYAMRRAAAASTAAAAASAAASAAAAAAAAESSSGPTGRQPVCFVFFSSSFFWLFAAWGR